MKTLATIRAHLYRSSCHDDELGPQWRLFSTREGNMRDFGAANGQRTIWIMELIRTARPSREVTGDGGTDGYRKREQKNDLR
jgi:hypothetical protein